MEHDKKKLFCVFVPVYNNNDDENRTYDINI